MKFTELKLPSNILESLEKMGFDEMTPIQEATYPVIFAGRDLCALAETGSGKTAACAIPLIHKVDQEHNSIQGLVIVPTRELCIQYVEEIETIAAKTAVVPFAVYGGFSKSIQMAKLRHGVHILVATPGRLIDLLYDGVIELQHVKCAILDEADELLKVGFLEDIEFIISCIRCEHQTLLFAATMADDIKKLAHDCLRDPEHISLIQKRPTPKSIEHCFAYVHSREKQENLIGYLEKEDVDQAIIFCNARHLVDKLFKSLCKHFKGIEYIHAGLGQDKRSSIFRQFKGKKIRYLIATDVAGRGLDFSKVSHVINWDFPGGTEQYTHRTGRTGRMGRKGKAFTFVTKRDLPNFSAVVGKKQILPHWIGRDPLKEENKFKDRTTPNIKKSSRPYPGRGRKTTAKRRS